jgi:hypothetical protein
LFSFYFLKEKERKASLNVGKRSGKKEETMLSLKQELGEGQGIKI